LAADRKASAGRFTMTRRSGATMLWLPTRALTRSLAGTGLGGHRTGRGR
jgi:hypothetical protein